MKNIIPRIDRKYKTAAIVQIGDLCYNLEAEG